MKYFSCIPLAIFIVSVALQVYWHIQEIKIPQKNKLKIKINRYICIFAMSMFCLSLYFLTIFFYTFSWTEKELISCFQNWGIFKIIFQILVGSCVAIHLLSLLSSLIVTFFENKLSFEPSDSINCDIALWTFAGIINVGFYIGYWDMLSV